MWKIPVMVGAVLLCAACTQTVPDPPALPDPPRYVPPEVTLPSGSIDAGPTRHALAAAPLVTLPPPEAVPTPQAPPAATRGKRPGGHDPIRQAEQASLLTPSRSGFADNTSAILRYPYRTGAVYVVATSPAHATTLVLPPGLHLSTPLVLDPGQWDVGYAKMDENEEQQEAVIVRPSVPGLEATTPLVTKSGHLFLLRLKSQDTPGVLAATWELPLVKVVIGGEGETGRKALAPTIDVSRLHTHYSLTRTSPHPLGWMPVEAYDDGRVTVVRFAESLSYTSAPVLMGVSPDGKDVVPLEYTTYQVPGHPERGEFYLTRGIYPRLRLLDAAKGSVDIVRLPLPAPTYEGTAHAP